MGWKEDEERRKRLAQYAPDYDWDTTNTYGKNVPAPAVTQIAMPQASTASFATRRALNLMPMTQGVPAKDPDTVSTPTMPGSNVEYWEKGMPKTATNQNKKTNDNLGKDMLDFGSNIVGGAIQGAGSMMNTAGKLGKVALTGVMPTLGIYDKLTGNAISQITKQGADATRDALNNTGEKFLTNNQDRSDFYNQTMGVGQSIGQMIPQIATTMLTGVPTPVIMGMTNASDEYDKNIQKGMSNSEATLRAVVSGVIEGGSEYIGGGKDVKNLLMGNWKALLAKEGEEAAENAIKKTLGQKAFGWFKENIIKEALQEAGTEVAHQVADATINMAYGRGFDNDPNKTLLDNAIDVGWAAYGGAAMGGLVSGTNHAVRTIANLPGLGQVELIGKPSPNTTNIMDATGNITEVNDALLKNTQIEQMQVEESQLANTEAAPEVTPKLSDDERLNVAVKKIDAVQADYESGKIDSEAYTKQLAQIDRELYDEPVETSKDSVRASEEVSIPTASKNQNTSISDELMSKSGRETWNKIVETVKKDNPKADIKLVKAKSGFQKHVAKLMKSLGTEVVFYKGDTNVNGFADPRVTNTIFVKVDNERNELMQTAGHEFLHIVAKRHAEDYTALLNFARQYFTPEARQKYLEGFKDNPGLYERHSKNEDGLLEEMLADELGNNFTNHSFWENLYNHSKELFEKLVKVAKGMIDEINKYGTQAAKNTSEWKTVTYVGQETARVLTKEFEKTIASVRKQIAEGKVDTEAKIVDSLYDRKDGETRRKYNGDALTPLEDIIKFALKKEQWNADQSTPEFGSVNNRMLKELEVAERLFGKIPDGYTANMPGKLEGSTRPLVRTITPSSLGRFIYDMIQSGEGKFLMEAPIEDIVAKRGVTGKDAKLLMDDLKSIRGQQPILSDNGKAGKSIDFLLGTCHPTRPCKECYAASAYIRMSAVRKAMRNTIRVYMDPFKFGKEAAKEVKKVDKYKLPFVRLLGSGDLTSDEQVDAFNTLAENLDRPIHIFSRHHDMMGRLISRPNAPFIKMGSIDIQLYEVYGVDYLANNLKDRGIANVFLYTSPTEFEALKSLKDRDAVKLILSASHELHDTLDKDKEIQASSCPCDAGERSYMHSCVQCAMSDMGCFMSFSTMGVDENGKVWDYMDLEAPEELTPIAVFGNEAESRSKAYAKVAVAVMKKSVELINLYERAFKKGERSTIPLKDIRFNGEDSVSYVDNIEASQWYKGKLKEMINAASKGSFYLPGGEIQPEVYFEKGRKVTDPKKIEQAKANSKITLAPHLKADAINIAGEDVASDMGISYSARTSEKEMLPNESKGLWKRGADFDEIKAQFPELFGDSELADQEKRHPTQVTNTVNTYRKIFEYLQGKGFKGSILDASSGLGLGTKLGREMGLDIEDLEPYPDKDYNPVYTKYSDVTKKYDIVISSAVLNVIPQDLRDGVVVDLGRFLKPNGEAYILTRGKDVENAKSKIAIPTDTMAYYIPEKKSYQKGFTPNELKAYTEDMLGEGFTIETVNRNNSPFDKGREAVIVSNKPRPHDENIKYSLGTAQKYFDAAERNLNERHSAFYSKLNKTIEQKMANSASSTDIMNLLRKNGVKEEEIKWSGIEEYLDANPKPKKSELMEFLNNSELQLEEVFKRDITEDTDYMYNTVAQRIKTELEDNGEDNLELTRLIKNWVTERSDDAEYELKRALLMKSSIDFTYIWEEVADGDEGEKVKFKKYASEGGRNYRELLITIPHKVKNLQAEKEMESLREEIMQARYGEGKYAGYSIPAANAVIKDLRLKLEDIRDNHYYRYQLENDYTSGHWKEDNVVAHTRLQDYTDHRGNKILRIEEIQSDWHQDGRKRGYNAPGAREKLTEEHNRLRREIKEYTQKIDEAYDNKELETAERLRLAHKLEDERFELEREIRRVDQEVEILSEQVPDAPFKKNWHEFVFKRILREAVEKGYDKVQWVGGKEQADRYSLAKHVTKITVIKSNKAEAYMLQAHNGNKVVFTENNYSENQIREAIGEELTDRILEKIEASKPDRLGYRNAELEGLDLEVGGEGMRGFYDKMLPDFVRKYTKKWGAELTRTPEDRWELPVTSAMKEEVLYKGQTLYSARKKELKAETYDSITPKNVWNDSYKNASGKLDEYRNKLSTIGKLPKLKDVADAEAVIFALRKEAQNLTSEEADKLNTEIARIGELIDSYYANHGQPVAMGAMLKALGSDAMVKYLRNSINGNRTDSQSRKLSDAARDSIDAIDKILEETDTEEEAKEAIQKYMEKRFKKLSKSQRSWIDSITEAVYGGDIQSDEFKNVFAAKWKIPNFTDKDAATILMVSDKLDGLKKGTKEYNQIANDLNDYMNSLRKHDIWEHLNTWENLMMLSGSKSAIRNILGNLARLKDYNIEEFSKALMDMLGSLPNKLTGKPYERSVMMPNIWEQIKGLGQGEWDEVKDVALNRDTRDVEDSREFAHYIKYKNPVLNVLQRWVRLLMSDRAFKQSVLNDYMARAEKLAKVNDVEFDASEAMQLANEIADETFFNGNDELIDAILKFRKDMNAVPINMFMRHIVGKKDYEASGSYGLGSWVLKFAKVPYNVSKFAIEREYHLAALKILTKAAVTGFSKARKTDGGYIDNKRFDVKAFTSDLSKLGNGLLITYLGSWLWQMGLVYVRPDDDDTDKKLLKLEKLLGRNKFLLNLSALRRYIKGEGKQEALPDDHYATLDWFVPTSILLIGGIKAQQMHDKKRQEAGEREMSIFSKWLEDAQEKITGLFEGTMEQVNGVLEMPMLSTLTKLKYAEDTTDKLAMLLLDALSRPLVPAPLKYTKDATDNVQRETYSNVSSEKWINNLKARVPMVSKELYPKLNMFGEELKVYPTGNSLWNVNVNPATMSRFSDDPVAQKINTVYEKYGLKDQIPMDVRKTWTIKKDDWYMDADELSVTLTSKEYYTYQLEFGKEVKKIAAEMAVYDDNAKAQEKEVNKIHSLYQKARDKVEKKILEARGLRSKTW